ncbi:tripartite tricarboxylate transporter substrate binding protein [Ottowia thiooxydans]|uniref:Tripartite-type tricarboxylate transporter receptor subunit TctC n=1 Tax=Ottowia thiooxydans TaxID=219182 RepID=A0ABV2QAZ7_9BURK
MRLPNLLRGLLATAALACGAVAAHAAWPERPVKLVVPFPAGGNVDAYARLLAPALSAELGQPVVIDNKAGATGAIGVEAVIRAEPDGYTVLMGNITSVVSNAIGDAPKFSPLKQLVPVCTLIDADVVVFAPSRLGVRNPTELKALAQKSNTPLTYGSSGAGSIAHMVMVQLTDALGIKATHVPYKGNGQFMTDLLAGHIQLGAADLPNSAQHVKAGTLVPLAVGGANRFAELPDVPTTRELGITRPSFTAWSGLLLPANTPQAIVTRLEAAAQKASQDPKVREFSSTNGNHAVFRNAAQTRQMIEEGVRDWGEFVRTTPAMQSSR